MIRAQTCPVCSKDVKPASGEDDGGLFPFCSDRCRQIDLYRWSVGRYAIVEPLDPSAHVGADSEIMDEYDEYDT